MPVTNAKDMLQKASEGRYAVGAFNVTNFIQFLAVVDEAVDRKAPVIVQTSVPPSKFLGAGLLVAAYHAVAGSAPVPVCLHLDHCTDVQYCKTCADAGYTNIMIDASAHDLDENVRQTAEVCNYVHASSSATVEGELGRVVGVEDDIYLEDNESSLCDPEMVIDFITRTNMDLFAPAIGTAHGVYKTRNPSVDFERFGMIRDRVQRDNLDVSLVVHGGTGLPESTVRKLVELGGAKFNVSTELKHTLIDTTHDYVSTHLDEYNPGKIDSAVRNAIRTIVGRWIEILGSTGRA